METEFYMIEAFANRDDFLAKATSYNLYFNLARDNSGKEFRLFSRLVVG